MGIEDYELLFTNIPILHILKCLKRGEKEPVNGAVYFHSLQFKSLRFGMLGNIFLKQLRAFRPRFSQLRSCVTTTTESFGASSSTTDGETEILNKLKENFPKAESIVVEDISGRSIAQDARGCGAMYQVQIVSEDFRGKTLVEQHKQVG
uniref:BolA-like protein 3 n=1 Tax=Romanomermis culicivorax TaxID=13658 RepID=A0A915L9C8_ROMCU